MFNKRRVNFFLSPIYLYLCVLRTMATEGRDDDPLADGVGANISRDELREMLREAVREAIAPQADTGT